MKKHINTWNTWNTKYSKYPVLFICMLMLVGCAGLNFGYKDPESGVVVTCVTPEDSDVSKCSYVGKDGKEVFVDTPVVGKDVEHSHEPVN